MSIQYDSVHLHAYIRDVFLYTYNSKFQVAVYLHIDICQLDRECTHSVTSKMHHVQNVASCLRRSTTCRWVDHKPPARCPWRTAGSLCLAGAPLCLAASSQPPTPLVATGSGLTCIVAIVAASSARRCLSVSNLSTERIRENQRHV